MKTQLVAAVLAMAICSAHAFCQADKSFEVAYRKWDVAGSVGALATNRRDPVRSSWGGTDTSMVLNADAGRYLSTHLKADFGVSINERRSFVEFVDFSSDMQSNTYLRTQRRLASFSSAATYQFLENAFVHPYVSVGARMTS